MTLIKFNIENKTKEQRKKEVLNKLRKIQSLVESDVNYTEMVYHIITNASLQKKNMKVNLDHYGNYTVIDASNKIVGGGMFNGVNASVQTSTNKVNTPIITSQSNTTSMNPRKNMKSQQSTITSNQNNKSTEKNTISQGTAVTVTDQNNSSSPEQATSQSIIKNGPEVSKDANTKGVTNTSVPEKKNSTAPKTTSNTGKNQEHEKNDFFSSIVNTLSGKKDTEGTAANASEQIGTESASAKASETESTGTGTQGEVAKASETVGTEGAAANASEQIDTQNAEKSTESKETGIFGIPKFWGGKNKTMDNDSYNSFHTTVFHEGGEDIFMEHIKNMSNKKYLRSLTAQELKDIMRSNHMKVTQNGSYYNKEQMVNKVYQFYK